MMEFALVLGLLAMQEAPAAEKLAQWCTDLGSEDPDVREAATAALCQAGHSGLRAVSPLRDSADPEIQGRAKRVYNDIVAALRPGALQLVVTPLSKSFKPGEEVRCTVALRNVEEFAVTIPRSAAATTQFAYASNAFQNGAQLEQAEEDFDQLSNSVGIHPRIRRASDVTLQPGESIDVTNEVTLTLESRPATHTTLEGLKAPEAGRYVVRAEFTPAASPPAGQSMYAAQINIRNVVRQQRAMPQQVLNSASGRPHRAPKGAAISGEVEVDVKGE